MGIEVQKSVLPTLFTFARVRAASQPHVHHVHNIFVYNFYSAVLIIGTKALTYTYLRETV